MPSDEETVRESARLSLVKLRSVPQITSSNKAVYLSLLVLRNISVSSVLLSDFNHPCNGKFHSWTCLYDKVHDCFHRSCHPLELHILDLYDGSLCIHVASIILLNTSAPFTSSLNGIWEAASIFSTLSRFFTRTFFIIV